MINRDLIRRKIVQLTYAYYQNSNHNIDNAEKELLFALSKSYDLYNYMLQLIVALTQEAQKRYEVEVARAQREGAPEPSSRFAYNRFAVQLEENKMLNAFDMLFNGANQRQKSNVEEQSLIIRIVNDIGKLFGE